MAGFPPRFTISNRGKVASFGPIGDVCSGITFSSPGIAPPAIWSAVHVEGEFYAFQRSNTNEFATAVENRVLACPFSNQKGQSSFRFVRNNDGTFLVHLNNSRAIWTVSFDGSLRLGPPIRDPTTGFTFTQAILSISRNKVMDGFPSRFTISNQGNVASIGSTGAAACSGITFIPPGIAPPAIWSAVPAERGFYAFPRYNTNERATAAVGITVFACPPSNFRGYSFRLIRTDDDTFMIQSNNSEDVWTVRSDGSLHLALSGIPRQPVSLSLKRESSVECNESTSYSDKEGSQCIL
ncbi:hypothetical protein AGABI1DRAFT_129738 [Agaricus bisporus var. burnettii JB137-S8]|uniref:Uncharacterized protein n=1 Tax=Agaricus bisporus var. burnettii (strain JB137-S8 / ATCC MYA-4627 / FGSC 10392) TaxID=597362 RepID=K5VU08_AGABU|nr:uncharacterized protein AGABI1DRAFT_129738 [Agaricus bisporus var. burnettii JB137-S8]EKM77949.1 hypothetical protein AGABI1DRAFT_129738 [Agaricus bisporus var. burnettii JB137-S8]